VTGTPRRRIVVLLELDDPRDPVAIVVDTVRDAGCTCDPPDLDYLAPGRVVVFHDRDCPLCPPLDEAAA
jgi:hypothetical protein